MKRLPVLLRSRIVRNLAKRVLLAEIASFLIIIILSFAFLLPMLNARAAGMANDVCMQMKTEVEATLYGIEVAAQYISSSRELEATLDSYYDNPSDRTFEIVRLTLNRLKLSHPEIRGLILEGPDRVLFTSIGSFSDYDYGILEQDWHKWARISDYGSGYSSVYDSVSPESSGRTAHFGAWSFAYSRSSFIGTDRYVLTLYCSAAKFLNNLEYTAKNTFSGHSLLDNAGVPFFRSGAIETDNFALQEAVATFSGISVTKQDGYFIVPVSASMWYLAAHADDSLLNSTFYDYFNTTIILFATLCVLTVSLIMYQAYRTVSPLGKLSKTMNLVSKGDLGDIVSDIKTGDEIEDLSNIFNEMICSLKEQIDRRISIERNEHKMKYGLLISQIDPHFICNTMNAINFLAKERRFEEIEAINTALIGLLRDRLRVDGFRVLDTVSHEIKTVNDYLLIQGYRYDNNARIDWLVDEEALELQIPKNVIQPLVENALFHGLMNEDTGEIRGRIIIEIRKNNGGILMRVKDDGRGIEAGKLSNLFMREADPSKRGRHIGLRNIKDRLAYLFNDKNHIEIESSNGTAVTIEIPCLDGADGEFL